MLLTEMFMEFLKIRQSSTIFLPLLDSRILSGIFGLLYANFSHIKDNKSLGKTSLKTFLVNGLNKWIISRIYLTFQRQQIHIIASNHLKLKQNI